MIKPVLAYIAAGALLIAGFLQDTQTEGQNMPSKSDSSLPDPLSQERFRSSNNLTAGNHDGGGYSFGPGMEIRWAAGNNDVSMPLLAIKIRLEHLQQTDLASDENAKLLWDLTKYFDKDLSDAQEIK